MRQEKNIDILLSTYNGSRFLSEQLDSILCQTNTQWKLFIRDDGSKDTTREIIEKYVSAHPEKIVWINRNDIRNVGVIKSFEELLNYSSAQYFMFCDQDDVWLPNKIDLTLNKIKELEKLHSVSRPIVVHTDLKVVDGKLNTISESMFAISRATPQMIYKNIYYTFICNCVTGCTLMGNMKSREISLPFPQFIDMHDSWVPRRTLLEGGVVATIYESTMLYRQHGFNVLGANPTISLKKRLMSLKCSYLQFVLLCRSRKILLLAPILFVYYKVAFKIDNLLARSRNK